MDRRTFLAGSAVLATTLGCALAGCTSGDGYTTSVGTPVNDSVSASVATASASAQAASERTASGSQIVAASAYDAHDYLPWTAASPLSWSANRHVTEALYEIDLHSYDVYAALASGDPEQLSDTVYRIRLRDGACFSDGTAVTGVDVASSFHRLVAAESPLAPLLACIEGMTALEDTEEGEGVDVTLAFDTPYLKERLSLVRVVPASASDDVLSSMPVGSGPWMYRSVSDASLVFAPSPCYNGPYPTIEKSMVWEVVKDDGERIDEIEDDAVQVMESMPPSKISSLTSASVATANLPGMSAPMLVFNTKKKPFDDYRVRQAFFYAIDTDTMVRDTMKGYAQAASCLLPTTHANYHKAGTVYTHDVEHARALLAEAGVAELSVTLDTTDNSWITALSSQIASDLETAGVTVSVQAQKTASLYAYRTDVAYPSFDVALVPGDASLFGNDADVFLEWWYGGNIWTSRRSQWADSDEAGELRDLIEQARTASDADRQSLLNACFDLIAEQVPIYPLLHRRTITAYRPNELDGYVPIAASGLDFIGVTSLV